MQIKNLGMQIKNLGMQIKNLGMQFNLKKKIFVLLIEKKNHQLWI